MIITRRFEMENRIVVTMGKNGLLLKIVGKWNGTLEVEGGVIQGIEDR